MSSYKVYSMPRIAAGKLDLEVEVYNINKGCNEELIKGSKYLTGYVTFESIVANEIQQNKKKLDEAFKIAYKYCEEHKIIAEFLRRHLSEVQNMLYTEFDMSRAWGNHAHRSQSAHRAVRQDATGLTPTKLM